MGKLGPQSGQTLTGSLCANGRSKRIFNGESFLAKAPRSEKDAKLDRQLLARVRRRRDAIQKGQEGSAERWLGQNLGAPTLQCPSDDVILWR